MTCTKTEREAQPIVDRWIDQACSIIEDITGVKPDCFDILCELADADWIISGGVNEEDEELLDMESTLRQLSYIVERTIDNIREEQEEND